MTAAETFTPTTTPTRWATAAVAAAIFDQPDEAVRLVDEATREGVLALLALAAGLVEQVAEASGVAVDKIIGDFAMENETG